MTLGDRVAVMELGELEQVDTPLRLYDKPANLFVAGFIGLPQMNLMESVAEGAQVRLGSYKVSVDETAARRMHGRVTVGVRPENWRIASEVEGGLPVQMTALEEFGAGAYVYGTGGLEGTPHDVIVRTPSRGSAPKGNTIDVTTDPAHVHVFDTETGRRLSA